MIDSGEVPKSPEPSNERRNLTSYLPNQLKDPTIRREFLGKLVDRAHFPAWILGWSVFANKVLQWGTSERKVDNDPSLATKVGSYQELGKIKSGKVATEFIGVSHYPEVFVAHKEQIREKIKKAPFVVLEYFSGSANELGQPGISDEELLKPELHNKKTSAFFAGVMSLCAEYGKDIIVVNPDSYPAQEFEISKAVALPSAYVMDEIKASYDRFKRHKTSRRGVVRSVAGVALATSWLQATGLPGKMREVLQKTGVLTSDLPPDAQANLIAWHILDWRNVLTAEGVHVAEDKLVTNPNPDDAVLVIQGSGHNSTMEYLENKKLRDAKLAFYTPYNLVAGSLTMHLYYSKEKRKWFLKEPEPYMKNTSAYAKWSLEKSRALVDSFKEPQE